jgi:hypothetical protein
MPRLFNVKDGVELIRQLSMRSAANCYLLRKVCVGAESEPVAWIAGNGCGLILRLAGSGWQGGTDGVEHADSARVKAITAGELRNSRMGGSKLFAEFADLFRMAHGPLVGHVLHDLTVFFCGLTGLNLSSCSDSRVPLIPEPHTKQKNAQNGH